MPPGAGARRLVAAVLLAALAAAGCGDADRRPHVLLVSLDTLRADALDAMPHLARRAREGVSLPRVYAASNWTLPSHVSLVLSQPYSRHRVPPLGARAPFAGVALAPEPTTLAEAFAAAGYRTVASTEGGYLDRSYGFGRGFDVYRMIPALLADRAADVDRHRRNVLETSKRLDRRPVFAFVHTYRVHDYLLNDPRFHRFLTADDATWAARGSLLERIWATGEEAPSPAFLERLYRGAAADADEHLDRLIRSLVDEVADRPWLVVVTSDHGEAFSEDPRLRSHGSALVEEQLRVPWIVWSSAAAWRPRIAPPRFAAGIDVAPSLLGYLGIAVPATFEGRADRLRGAPAGGDDGEESAEVAFFPYRDPGVRDYQLGLVTFDRALVRSENFGVAGALCYVRGADRPGLALWTGAGADVCAPLERETARRVRRWTAATPAAATGTPSASEAEREKLHRELKALGYL